jgi:hypothetical protein
MRDDFDLIVSKPTPRAHFRNQNGRKVYQSFRAKYSGQYTEQQESDNILEVSMAIIKVPVCDTMLCGSIPMFQRNKLPSPIG